MSAGTESELACFSEELEVLEDLLDALFWVWCFLSFGRLLLAEAEEPFAGEEDDEGVVDAVDAELPFAVALDGDFFLDFLDFFLVEPFPLAELWLALELELESEMTMLAPLKGTHFMFEFVIVEDEKEEDGVLVLLL